MKRLCCIIMLMITTICSIASAQVTLKVGYVPGTGFIKEDRHNHYLGYGYEYMEFLACYGDWKFEYVPSTTWEECGQKLQAGEIDVLPAMPGDYRTLQNVTRTDHVIGRYPMELVTKNGKTKPNMRIGTISSNAPIPSLPKIAQHEGFNYELINYNLFYDMVESFNRNEIDGYIAPMLEPNNPINENAAVIFDRQSYRLLVRSDRTDLLAAMNIAMDEMLMDQPNIRNRLNDKYLRTGGFPLLLSRQEKEYLAQKKKLTAAIFFKERPYAYTINGELHGVIPRIIKQVSEDLNIEIELIDTNNRQETEQLVQSGKIDFIADTLCDFSWAEKLNLTPTQSYLQIDYVPVIRQGSKLEDAVTVACDKDLLYMQTFVIPNYPEDKIVYEKSLHACFKAVNEGRADILYAPRSEVPYLIENTGSYNLEVASESDFADFLSLGVYKDVDGRLWRILNKEINHLDITKIRSIVNEDMNSVSHGLTPQWFIYHYPLRAMAFMFILITLIITFAWYKARLRRQHMNEVQQMAYTDVRYRLPNLSWLKSEAPKFYSQFEEIQGYVLVFSADNQIISILPYDKELRNKQVQKMAYQLNQMEQVLLTSTGNDSGSLVCICKSKNDSDITNLAKEIIRKYGYLETKDSRIWLHMKAGICRIDENNLQQSIEQAQIASLKAQDVLLFNSGLQDKLTFEQQVEMVMENALKNNEFHAWYQMEYDILNHEQIGAEAFVRWQSPELGFLLPEKFISIFERNGFIISIDYFMLDEVCKLQRTRIDEGKATIPISTNQSHLHLVEENYLNKMKSMLKKYKLPKNIIKLEFKESVFEGLMRREQRARIINIMSELQKIGFKISIDNFGSGNSSYTLLNNLPINEIKIDRSLLYSAIEINRSNRSYDILESIIQLSKRLGMKVICEGIETKEQEQLLLKAGCQYGQGFLNDESHSEFLT